MRYLALLAALAAVAANGLAADGDAGVHAAHAAPAAGSAPAAVVEARRAGFKKMGSAMRFINDQLKSGDGDPVRLGAAADDLAALSPKVKEWFPAGTGQADGFDTDALDYIWKQRGKFDALAGQLEQDVKALAAGARSGDAAALRAQARTVGAVCADCHRSFRAD